MREEIITLLSNKSTLALNSDDIAKKLSIKNKKELRELLNQLVSEGILDFSPKKNKYLLFENSHLVKTTITIDKNGNGIAKIDGKIINIPKRNLRGAAYNDTVAIAIDELNNTGTIARILERDNSNYVGEVISKNDKLYIKDERLGIINIGNEKNLVEGHKVLLHHENGQTKIAKVLGHKDDPGVDIMSILYDHGFDEEYNEELNKELEDIPTYLSEQEINQELANGRIDYRKTKVVTIDCDDTKDIDDAVSIKQLDNGNIELKVFIADVSHYIKENSALDKEAHKRGTSVYPPGSVVPMFDHKISNGICSLNPNVDRLAMCYTTIFDSNGKVVDFEVEEAIINSNMKMKYSDINKILENDEVVEGYQDYLKELYLMKKLSLLIEKQLLNNGYLNFLSTETKVILNEDYSVNRLEKRYNGTAEKIIEYFMITTNIEIAKYAFYLNLPHIYRIHGEPDQERLITTYKVLKSNNYISMKEKKNYSNKDIQKTINALNGKENAEIFSLMLITSQDKAKYSIENIGHYALGTILYSHNTSPIRRKPDLENQRVIKSFLHNGLNYTQYKYNNLKEKAIHYSNKERDAEAVEHEATDMKKAEYMESHIGETYTGYISYVARFGFWIILENGVEAFVHINNLPHDKYSYSEEILALIGKNNYSFHIGDKLEVKIKNANKENRTIDCIISKEYLKENVTQNSKVKKKTRIR